MAKKRHYHKRKKHLPAGLKLIIGILIFGALVVGGTVYAQHRALQQQLVQSQEDTQDKEAFIKNLAPYAQELQRVYKVLPSITLAQAILESNWGHSTLAAKYHNLFGIKGSSAENTQELTTQEYVNGQWETVKARFRVYQNDQQSMRDHALLFVHGTDWNANQYQGVLAASNYRQAAEALKKSGYATDPDYPQKLIRLVQQYHLDQYDQ